LDESEIPLLANFQAIPTLTLDRRLGQFAGRRSKREGGAMFDVLFEAFRKASESTGQMPLDIYKNWTKQMMAIQPNVSGASMEWTRTAQKRWAELAIESLHKQRESLDTTFRSGIQLIEQAFRLSEAKSSDDYKRVVDELSRKLLDVFKEQSESQVREFQTWAAKSIEMQQASA
jgi:hypothetical protein